MTDNHRPTVFQARCIALLAAAPSSVSTNDLAHSLKTSRVAVVSAMRSPERHGLAGSHRWPPIDQWAALFWFLRGRRREIAPHNQLAKNDSDQPQICRGLNDEA
ncbi:hypothetical protein [Burkholderia cepacia]|uniref:hypothetical protein n=1 Tax=Burkholderia cepacia TaxID=292 RepID=UPI002AB5F249|nr:hypothetical protein [Burkholderia cepacia]